MMLFLDNILAWSAQVCILAAAATGAVFLLTGPCARLAFWQAALAAMLLLPLWEPFHPPAVAQVAPVSFSPSPVITPGPSSPVSFWRSEYWLALLAAGAAFRMIWIAAGLVRLRRYRLTARVLIDPPIPFERSHVRWYLSDRVSGPVAFGWKRPSILLPTRVNELPDDLREAIACHELTHVRRGDWLFVIFEELIRAILWFHPAVWFVLSRIQLTREQTVDLEVVRLTGNRDGYLHALVAVAAQRLHAGVAPAPLFLKKRQLAARVAAILNFKEGRVSKSGMILRFAIGSLSALAAMGAAAWFFPLQSPVEAQSLAPDSFGVTVDPGGKLLHRAPVVYSGPEGGTVVISAILNSKGEVADARVVSGPDALRKAALQSVLEWHYSPETGTPNVQITIQFPPLARAGAPGVVTASEPLPGTASNLKGVVKAIEFRSVPPELAQQVRERYPLHVGDPVSSGDEVRAFRQSGVRDLDEHLDLGVNWTGFGVPNPQFELTIYFFLNNSAPAVEAQRASGPPVGPSPLLGHPQEAVAPSRIRVGSTPQAANLVSKVNPIYPPEAKEAGIQGVVRFTATIGKDGSVENLQFVSGHPLLAPAALEAVKHWVYKPTLLNGEPVQIITQIDVNFTLSQ